MNKQQLQKLKFGLKYISLGFLAVGLIFNYKILIGFGLFLLAVFFMIKKG